VSILKVIYTKISEAIGRLKFERWGRIERLEINELYFVREKSEEMLVRLVEKVIDKINKELNEQEYW